MFQNYIIKILASQSFHVLIVLVFYFSSVNDVRAHPDLMLDQVDENEKIALESKYEVDSQTGKVKFEIKPNFIKGSPVHEKMTEKAITLSNIHSRAYAYIYDLPYIKGIFWNDDPELMLCPWCDYFHIKKWGPQWALKFLTAKSQATREKNPILFVNGDSLLSRSHFGDLQFLHAMAYKNGVPTDETLKKILIWSEFTYKVGIGEISGRTKIRNVQVEGFSNFFDKDKILYDQDVASLFHDRAVKRIAIGSFLHLIQDSYSLSHVERQILDNKEERFCRTKIIRFHAYSGQNTDKHAQADKWPSNLITTSANNKTCDPIVVGAKILSYYADNDFAGAKWEVVKIFLVRTVFPLGNPEELSNSGREFME